MAERIIGASSTTPIPRERGTAEFFTLNAKYLIDPESKTEDIGRDVACMHDCLISSLQVLSQETERDHTTSSMVFTALYQARQAAAMSAEYVARTDRTPGSRDDRGGEIERSGEGAASNGDNLNLSSHVRGIELEDDLKNARHLAVMVQWIGVAQSFIEAVRDRAKVYPEMVEELRVYGVYINDPEWGECEGDALRHLHQRIECSIRDIEVKVGLNEECAR